MPRVPNPSPAINRLRAAAGLLPIIESGLTTSKLAHDRAAIMAEFCLWSIPPAATGDPEIDRLADEVRTGLARVTLLLDALPA